MQATPHDHLGGTEGNQILTSADGAILTILLLAEGVTILWLGDLLTPHMFIGLVLIGPVLLKLSSTGYRFARYYTDSPSYREKGEPPLALRLLAPVLIALTVVVLGTGVWLLLLGHNSDTVLEVHQLSFIDGRGSGPCPVALANCGAQRRDGAVHFGREAGWHVFAPVRRPRAGRGPRSGRGQLPVPGAGGVDDIAGSA